MRRIILSLIVIICTVVCVMIMLFSDKVNEKQKPVNNKIQVIDTKKDLEVAKQSTNDSKQGTSEEKSQNISNDKNLKDNAEKKTYIATDAYRKMKMNEINGEIEHDKKVFFQENNKDKNTKKDISNNKQETFETSDQESSESVNGSESKDSIPVFKVSKSKIKDSLTLSDKEKLLSIASKLSAIDYEKINKYLEGGSDEDIKNTIKLLKSRLSDKDYEKVKGVAEKFINMDAVEQ